LPGRIAGQHKRQPHRQARDTAGLSGTVIADMGNFFLDTPELRSIFRQLDLREVAELLEDGYLDEGELVPRNYEDARAGYEVALELTGAIAADVIAPRSRSIDADGAVLVDGEVRYPEGLVESYRRLAEAGLTGALLPRRFGGLNMPGAVYVMMVEMVSRGDGSVMTMFGYQDVGEAIAHFGPQDLADEVLPRLCAGDVVASMVLTEPGGGSDLAGIRTKAFLDEDGHWRLRGSKQFISNANGGLLLVLARSEPGVEGVFGLSLFASDGTGVQISRLEEKMGQHGSPTCEVVFDDAPARLVGKRRMGMSHTMHTLNLARLSVAAQALGIADAAWRSARAYADERKAFGKPIREFGAVAGMLADMSVTVSGSRAMLYEASRRLDLRNQIELEIGRRRWAGAETGDLPGRLKQLSAEAEFLSRAVKAYVTEAAQRVCNDAMQIFGGMGYIRETGMEQRVRDVRITTIYEGTTQVQTSAALAAAISDVLGGSLVEVHDGPPELSDRVKQLGSAVTDLRELAATLDTTGREAASRDVVEAYIGWWTANLLFQEAAVDPKRIPVCERWIGSVAAHTAGAIERVRGGMYEALQDFNDL